jgi:hypothetical protein
MDMEAGEVRHGIDAHFAGRLIDADREASGIGRDGGGPCAELAIVGFQAGGENAVQFLHGGYEASLDLGIAPAAVALLANSHIEPLEGHETLS